MATAVVPVNLKAGRQTIATSLPTLKYTQAVKLAAQVGLLGAELAGGGFGQPLATVELTNPRTGKVKPPLAEVKP